jgi:hypothetical protein
MHLTNVAAPAGTCLSGDGTTDCCVMEHTRGSSGGSSSSIKVLGAHGNSYLGAADVKHAVLSRLPEEVLRNVPEVLRNVPEPLVVSQKPLWKLIYTSCGSSFGTQLLCMICVFVVCPASLSPFGCAGMLLNPMR